MKIIDLNRNPKIGKMESVLSHEKNGILFFNCELLASRVKLFLSEEQCMGGISGEKLLKTLSQEKKVLCNSVLLDWLLENPDYIPENWKDKFTLFPGTVFIKNGITVIRYLYYGLNGWASSYSWLNRGFHKNNPVATLEIVPGKV